MSECQRHMAGANRSAMTVPPPRVLAMVVCDQVHEDPSTGKYTILGTFDRVASPSFPYTHPAVTSFMQVTNGRGEVEIRVKDAEEGAAHPYRLEIAWDE